MKCFVTLSIYTCTMRIPSALCFTYVLLAHTDNSLLDLRIYVHVFFNILKVFTASIGKGPAFMIQPL